MDENMKVSEPDEQDVNDMLDDEEDDDVFSAEIEEDESDPYELTDEEIAELADEEDEDEAEEDDEDEESDEGEESDEDEHAGDADGNDDAEDEGGEENSAPSDPPAEGGEGGEASSTSATDYAKMAADDLAVINRAFPGMNVTDLRKIDNPGRYGALRDLGLSPEEAFRATNHARIHEQVAAAARAKADGKAHIRSDMPAKGTAVEGFSLSAEQLREARELFPGKSDKEITALYRSVSH